MKIDFDQRVKTIGGKPVNIDPTSSEPDTLGDLCLFSLATMTKHDEPPERKFQRYKLGRCIEPGGEIDLKSEDIILIKDCAGSVLTPFAYGAVVDLLE